MQRCGRDPTLPDTYLWPTRRPCSLDGGHYLLWDMAGGEWPTASEWLALVRRRRHDWQKRVYSHGRWHVPVRPIVQAHTLPWSTRKIRRLPKNEPNVEQRK